MMPIDVVSGSSGSYLIGPPVYPAGGAATAVADWADLAPRALVGVDLSGPLPIRSSVPKELRELFFERLDQTTGSTAWLPLDERISTMFKEPPHPKRRADLDWFTGRLTELASDPAQGNKLDDSTIEEAVIACVAEWSGILKAPLVRDPTGLAEFIDPDGGLWDVKSPVSPEPGATWTFDPKHIVKKVRHDIEQDNSVLLNLSRCTPENTRAALETLRVELTPAQRLRVVALVNR